ncbi:MAG: anaerobic ribonucleoside-triphosphate reductase activating protein [Campylobacterota bacterium]
MSQSKPIEDITPFTMLDFKGYTSAIVWFCGCNMRCGYCYNPEIVHSRGKISFDAALKFLQSRKKLLNGVVLSGGEPTLYPKLGEFALEVKQMGYKIKLDTNGTKPQAVQKLLESQVIDFVSLDYKAPQYKFKEVTKLKQNDFFKVLQTVQLLQNSGISYEVRTTVHGQLLNSEDIIKIIDDLKKFDYDKTFYIQNFLESNNLDNLQPYEKEYDLVSIVKAANEKSIQIDFRNF